MRQKTTVPPSSVSIAEHRALALWAANCAERVLSQFESARPGDERPRRAIAAARAWVRGELKMTDARRAAFAAHAAARDAGCPAACAAARAAGHAAATAHVASHAKHASTYARKAESNRGMPFDDSALLPFLRPTPVIDYDAPAVVAQAAEMARPGVIETARACFEFVRDDIQHSRDYERDPSTWRASDVLQHRTGYCYAKSHLLAALLRANGIPAGFCYQRLSVNDTGGPYCLHGFNAVHLPGTGWYRVDARGNKPGVDAQFTPPVERLAFALRSAEEFEFENVWAEPLDVVLDVLKTSAGWEETLGRLPDVGLAEFGRLGFAVRATGTPQCL